MIRLYTDSHELYDDKLVDGLQSAPNILGLLNEPKIGQFASWFEEIL